MTSSYLTIPRQARVYEPPAAVQRGLENSGSATPYLTVYLPSNVSSRMTPGIACSVGVNTTLPPPISQ